MFLYLVISLLYIVETDQHDCSTRFLFHVCFKNDSDSVVALMVKCFQMNVLSKFTRLL